MRHRPSRSYRVLPLVLLTGMVAGLLAGCGGGGTPAHRAWRTQTQAPPTAVPVASTSELGAAEIVTRAIRTTQAAAAVRIRGQFKADGQDVALDMRYDATGGGGRVKIEEQTIDVLRIQREFWFAGDERFWRRVGGNQAVRDYQAKYLKIPASDQRFTPLLNTTYVGKLLTTLVRAKGPFVKAGTVTMRGQRAVVVVDKTKDYGGTLWVAADGPPYLLRIQAAPDSRVSGAVDFGDYNKRFSLAPPNPRRVIAAEDLAESS